MSTSMLSFAAKLYGKDIWTMKKIWSLCYSQLSLWKLAPW